MSLLQLLYLESLKPHRALNDNHLSGKPFSNKEITGSRIYKKSFVNIVETALYFNLLALSANSWYRFKNDIVKQTAVAYTSTIIIFILLVGVIIYHAYRLVRKDRPHGKEVNEYPLAPVQPAAKAEVTHSVIEIPKPRNQRPSPCEQIELSITPMYQ